MYFYVAFDIQLIVIITLAFVFTKLMAILYVVLDDSTFFFLELQHKIKTNKNYERGIISPYIKSEWYLAKIWTILVTIVVCQQVILIPALMDIARWQSTIEQIMKFHHSNTNVPRPKILADILKQPSSWLNILYYFLVALCLGALFMTSFDRKFVEWINKNQRGTSCVSRAITLLPILALAYYLTVLTSHYISDCTNGEYQLNIALPSKEKIAEYPDLSHVSHTMIELQGQPNDMDYE